jgi:hypothetical protein
MVDSGCDVWETETDSPSSQLHLLPFGPHIPGQSQSLGTLWSKAPSGKEPANYTTNESLPAHPVSSLFLRP